VRSSNIIRETWRGIKRQANDIGGRRSRGAAASGQAQQTNVAASQNASKRLVKNAARVRIWRLIVFLACACSINGGTGVRGGGCNGIARGLRQNKHRCGMHRLVSSRLRCARRGALLR